jgi:hypothetical protein
MKILSVAKDGGAKSNVTGLWIIECKSLFSVVLLKFGKGSREAFHSHAFNAVTWFLFGHVTEHHLNGPSLDWRGSIKPKFTPRRCFHKVYAHQDTYAISFRGPWAKTWQEYLPASKSFVTLTNGRKLAA